METESDSSPTRQALSSFSLWKQNLREKNVDTHHGPLHNEDDATLSHVPVRRSDMGVSNIVEQRRSTLKEEESRSFQNENGDTTIIGEEDEGTFTDENSVPILSFNALFAIYIGLCIIMLSFLLLKGVTWHGKMAEFMSFLTERQRKVDAEEL